MSGPAVLVVALLPKVRRRKVRTPATDVEDCSVGTKTRGPKALAAMPDDGAKAVADW